MERCSTLPCTDDGLADTSVAVVLAVTFAAASNACVSACIATCHPWRCFSGHCIAIHPDTLRLGVRFCGRSTPRIQGLVVADSIIHACMRYDVLLYMHACCNTENTWWLKIAGGCQLLETRQSTLVTLSVSCLGSGFRVRNTSWIAGDAQCFVFRVSCFVFRVRV